MGTSFCMTVATVTGGGGGVGCSLVEEQAVQTAAASNTKPNSGKRRFCSSSMAWPPEHPESPAKFNISVARRTLSDSVPCNLHHAEARFVCFCRRRQLDIAAP